MNKPTRLARLRTAHTKLLQGENVQNRQLRTLLSEEEFARFEGECREQKQLRETLRQKPEEIVEYERLLKMATFTYNRADATSRVGRRTAAAKMFSRADTEFERLAEYLSEKIAGHLELELWLDRDVHFDAATTPTSSSDAFPCVVTSRSLRKTRGGMFAMKRSRREVKLAAIERAIEVLGLDENVESQVQRRIDVGRSLLSRISRD